MYRRFVPNFAHVAAPLNQLLTKGVGFHLPPPTEETLEAFERLKSALVTPPVLQLPDPAKEYSLDTDASAHQVGCALFQHADPIGFWSRSLTDAEKNYSAAEREALAIIFAVQTLHPYVWGRRFTVYTDHQALRWVFNLDDPTGRLSRWALRLQDFDFVVKYKKGADNVVADAVSRLPTYGLCDFEVDVDLPVFLVDNPSTAKVGGQANTSSWTDLDWDPEGNQPSTITVDPVCAVELITTDELIDEQSRDEECQAILRLIESGKSRDFQLSNRGDRKSVV